jgi:hypothetical protein
VFGIHLSMRSNRGGSRHQLGLEASRGGIQRPLVVRADVDWNEGKPNLSGGFNSVAPSGHHQTSTFNDLGFEPVVNAGWREQVVVGVPNSASVQIGAGAHPLEVLRPGPGGDSLVYAWDLRHVGAHLLWRRFRRRQQGLVLLELPCWDSDECSAPHHDNTFNSRPRDPSPYGRQL